MTPRQQLTALTDRFREMDDSDLRMDCLLVLAAGDDNAGDTLGWEETEDFFLLSLKSVECLLSSDETSEAVKAEFHAAGIRW